MIWAFGIIAVILILSAVSRTSKATEEAQKNAEFNDLSNKRTEAYHDYLRRTSDQSEFSAMSDGELKEFLSTNIREFNKEKDGLQTVAVFVGLAGWFGGGVFALFQSEWWPFIVVGVLATIGAVVVFQKGSEALNKNYIAKGLDIERLKIEQ